MPIGPTKTSPLPRASGAPEPRPAPWPGVQDGCWPHGPAPPAPMEAQWVPPWDPGVGEDGAGEAKPGCGVGGSPTLGLGHRDARASPCRSRAHAGLCPGADPSEGLRAPGAFGGDSLAGSPMGHPTAGPCSPPGPGQRAAPEADRKETSLPPSVTQTRWGCTGFQARRVVTDRNRSKAAGRKRLGGMPTAEPASGHRQP